MDAFATAFMLPAQLALAALVRRAGTFRSSFLADAIVDVTVSAGRVTFEGAIPAGYAQSMDVASLAFEHLAHLAMDAAPYHPDLVALARKELALLVHQAGAGSYQLHLLPIQVTVEGRMEFPAAVPLSYWREHDTVDALRFLDLVALAAQAARRLAQPTLPLEIRSCPTGSAAGSRRRKARSAVTA